MQTKSGEVRRGFVLDATKSSKKTLHFSETQTNIYWSEYWKLLKMEAKSCSSDMIRPVRIHQMARSSSGKKKKLTRPLFPLQLFCVKRNLWVKMGDDKRSIKVILKVRRLFLNCNQSVYLDTSIIIIIKTKPTYQQSPPNGDSKK